MDKNTFFKKRAEEGFALTFDDVTLVTTYSEVMPHEADITTMFSRNIPLKLPIASAAMDTVTEYQMGISMALAGGIGVIHKNNTAGEQARHVDRVKKHMNAKVERPITVRDIDTIESILNMKQVKGYTFSSFPVVNGDGKLVGVLTGNDFDFCIDYSLPAREIMTSKVIWAEPRTAPDEAYKIMLRQRVKVLPLLTKSRKIVGMYTFKDLKGVKTGSSSKYNLDNNGQLRVAAAIGVGDSALERLEHLVRRKVDCVVIDTAHADHVNIYNTLVEIKRAYPNLDVIVGNISNPESAKRLVEAGADAIKPGQGGGSICTTRKVSGIGIPQITAVAECAMAIEGSDVPVISDGGIRFSGDIPKAIAAGAHSVMLGNLLAGTVESPGEFIFKNGAWVKAYRGMGSLGAMKEHEGSRERYSQVDKDNLVPEGIEGEVPYRGPLAAVLIQYEGGLRKGMGYTGSRTIEDLRTKAEFKFITNAGSVESHPHSIEIVKEAPNYSLPRKVRKY